MKQLKKIFDIWIALLITIIIGSNIVFILYFMPNISKEYSKEIFYFGGILIFEIILVLFLIYISYITPINELKKHIILFLSWQSKGDTIKVKTNYINPNIKISLSFFDSTLNALKNIKDEFMAGKAIKWEVQLATELQEKLLNKKLETIPSLEVIAKSKPAWEIWWDSYDIIKANDNYYLYVWDATGHWVGAGFVMVMVNALVSWFSKIFHKWSEILANTNEILKPRVKSNILMTVLLLRWNEVQKRLFMTGAGHEYLLIYKHNVGKCFKLKSGWLALGMTKNIHNILKEQEIKFEKNDIAVLYTDGITEWLNWGKKDGTELMFWEQRLMEAIEWSPNLPLRNIKTARGVFNSITIELSKFMWYKHKQFDDITLVVIHYKWEDSIENDFPEEISSDSITEWNWI